MADTDTRGGGELRKEVEKDEVGYSLGGSHSLVSRGFYSGLVAYSFSLPSGLYQIGDLYREV